MRQRRAGISLHPAHLSGAVGIGDLGPASEKLLEWAESAGQQVWHLPPLGPTGGGHSPYLDALSGFAGDPNLISLERIVEMGILPGASLEALPKIQKRYLDFDGVAESKSKLLRLAWREIQSTDSGELRTELETFLEDPHVKPWLFDWALFAALRDRYEGAPWWTWDEPLRRRDAEALRESGNQLRDEVEYHSFLQFLFHRQWTALRSSAQEHGIELYGDLPFAVARDSADVWAYGELFTVNRNGELLAQAGQAPSDATPQGATTGQPLFRWARMEASGFRWWIERLRRSLFLFDRVRLLDLGNYAAAWKLPPNAKTAEAGEWLDGPGLVLFQTVYREMDPPPIMGSTTEPLTTLRFALDEALDIPPTRELLGAFHGLDTRDMPHRFEPRTVVFVGVPEGSGFRSRYESLEKETRTRLLDYFGKAPGILEWEMLRAAYASVATLAIVSLQDLMVSGTEGKDDPPGHSGKWGWRLAGRHLNPSVAGRLHRLAEITGRLGGASPDDDTDTASHD